MPLYEYLCDQCGHRFEVIQKFSDAPIAVCPSCGGPVQKLPSSPAIQFKGSGFYITDYARAGKSDSGGATSAKTEGTSSSSGEGSSTQAKSDAKTEAKSEGKTESKAESKSDAKTESKPSASTKSD
jgi:putative FmdB family regulatory protein